MTAKTAQAKPAAKRAAPKNAAGSYTSKRRLLSKKLKTLREESEALAISTSQLLSRLSP